MNDARTGNQWAIVLAAGEGTRLSALTEALHGSPVPKQFAALCGSRSFLQKTVDRIGGLIPPQRTVVVVAESRLALAREQLAGYAGIEIVAQPDNRGTGTGVLLPLMHVLARDPEAEVVVLPSDHHVEREPAFLDAIRHAFVASERAPSRVALVGAAAEAPAVDLGWIACGSGYGSRAGRARRVRRFVEKPPVDVALDLLREGALWNTLVIAARGRALLDLAHRHAPEVAQGMICYKAALGRTEAKALLRAIYRGLTDVDLSRDMLQPARGLAAVAMVDAGWSDCGTSERLFRALETTGELSDLLARLPDGAGAALRPS